MTQCNYERVEPIVKKYLNKNMPGIYYVLRAMIEPGSNTLVMYVLLENPTKIVAVLLELYDNYTAQLVAKHSIIEPLLGHYGGGLGYNADYLTELLFTNPSLFSRILQELLCGS